MSKNIVKRTVAGATALLSVAGNIPAMTNATGILDNLSLFASADTSSHTIEDLAALHDEANEWFEANVGDLEDEEIESNLQDKLIDAEILIDEAGDGEEGPDEIEINDAYSALEAAYNAAKEALEDQEPVTLEYEATNWNWAEDFSSCQVTIHCTNNDDVQDQTVDAVVASNVDSVKSCTTDGQTTYTATYVMGEQTFTDSQVVTEPAGHTWELLNWIWDQNDVAVARLKCSECGEVVPYLADVTPEVTDATCEEDGQIKYHAVITIGDQVFEDEKTVKIDALGHDYGEPAYTWKQETDADGKTVYSCTASRTCKNDESHVDTEDAKVDFEVITPATLTQKGIGKYVAKFNNEAFKTQTKIVEIAVQNPEYKKPVYTWSKDNKTCIAYAECINGSRDFDIIENGKVSVDVTKPATCTEKGQTTYTATFENVMFEQQEVVLENIDATGHTYGDPQWTWTENEDGTWSAGVIFECDKDNHTEDVSENVEVTFTSTKTPTCTEGGTGVYTAKVTFEGKEYTDTRM